MLDREVLSIGAADDHHLRVAFHEEAIERTLVLRLDEEVLVAFANLRAGVHDVQQHGVEISVLIRGEVRSHLAAAREQRVTRGAGGVVERLSRVGISRPATHHAGEPLNLRLHFSCRGGSRLRPVFRDERGEFRVLVQLHAPHVLQGQRPGFDRAVINGLHDRERPRRTAGESVNAAARTSGV